MNRRKKPGLMNTIKNGTLEEFLDYIDSSNYHNLDFFELYEFCRKNNIKDVYKNDKMVVFEFLQSDYEKYKSFEMFCSYGNANRTELKMLFDWCQKQKQQEDKITVEFDFLNKDEFVSMIEQLHRDIENLKKENDELEKENQFLKQEIADIKALVEVVE